MCCMICVSSERIKMYFTLFCQFFKTDGVSDKKCQHFSWRSKRYFTDLHTLVIQDAYASEKKVWSFKSKASWHCYSRLFISFVLYHNNDVILIILQQTSTNYYLINNDGCGKEWTTSTIHTRRKRTAVWLKDSPRRRTERELYSWRGRLE